MNKEIENIIDNFADSIFNTNWTKLLDYIKNIEKENQQLKKQKDDVVEYIKSYNLPEDLGHFGEAPISIRELREILRMLGEIDVEN